MKNCRIFIFLQQNCKIDKNFSPLWIALPRTPLLDPSQGLPKKPWTPENFHTLHWFQIMFLKIVPEFWRGGCLEPRELFNISCKTSRKEFVSSNESLKKLEKFWKNFDLAIFRLKKSFPMFEKSCLFCLLLILSYSLLNGVNGLKEKFTEKICFLKLSK